MTKSEIIAKTLKDMNLVPAANEPAFSDEPDEEEFIISVLQDVLPDADIRTCEDFRHLNVGCCETCHNFYPHYEMRVVVLPDGGKAWVCDTVKRAIFPEQLIAL